LGGGVYAQEKSIDVDQSVRLSKAEQSQAVDLTDCVGELMKQERLEDGEAWYGRKAPGLFSTCVLARFRTTFRSFLWSTISTTEFTYTPYMTRFAQAINSTMSRSKAPNSNEHRRAVLC
jgi:hypothetical protein